MLVSFSRPNILYINSGRILQTSCMQDIKHHVLGRVLIKLQQEYVFIIFAKHIEYPERNWDIWIEIVTDICFGLRSENIIKIRIARTKMLAISFVFWKFSGPFPNQLAIVCQVNVLEPLTNCFVFEISVWLTLNF